MLLDTLETLNVRRRLAGYDVLRDVVAGLAEDADLLRAARRALLPLPYVDRPKHVMTSVFPRFRSRPIPYFKDKRVAVVLSGGSGASVAALGVFRALEEAEIDPVAISVCSASALWGTMLAAGLEAQEMVDFALSWRPEDYLDIQWSRLPLLVLSAMRGFTGVAKSGAIERLYDRRLWHMSLGKTQIPIYSVAYNLDLGRLETFGSKLTPKLTVGELVAAAIAEPLVVEAVRVDGHLYVDGGIVDVFPSEPLESFESVDCFLGLNTTLPPGLASEDISGWTERPMGFVEAAKQVRVASHADMVRRTRERLGDRLILLEPVTPKPLAALRFYDLFLDRKKWPALITAGYEHTKQELNRFRPKRRPSARSPIGATGESPGAARRVAGRGPAG